MLNFLKTLFRSEKSIASDAPISLDTEALASAEEETEEGSLHKVPYTKIVAVYPHNNAERLEVAEIYGFQVIVQKGRYKPGDSVIYIPIDSLLPQNLEDILFPPDSKIKLTRHRVRQIRIRGLASQGMVVDPESIKSIVNPEYFTDEQDLKKILGVKKYQPPQPGFSQTVGKGRNRNKKHEHPLFHKYNGVENIKWFPDLFKEGEQVVVQEKLHGSNCRLGILPFQDNTLLKKIKKFLKIAPAVEKVYGSNNVDITAASGYSGFYGSDVYGDCLHRLDAFSKLQVGEIVYGELIGPGIQKNYDYGLKEHNFVVFDVKRLNPDGKSFTYLTPSEVEAFCKERGFEYVPVAYQGAFNKEMIYAVTKGASLYDPKTKVREGVVIKASENYDVGGNKKALKWINEAYLDDKNNSDFR